MNEELKTKKIILFDGVCALCNNFIVFIAKKDKKDKFRFLPLQNQNIEQFIDFLGIMGDTSDNIPGVFGVGEKTAQKLITEYGSIEQVYEGIDNIKGKLKEKLENSKENAFLSKDLVTIATNAPVKFSFDDFKIKEPNFQQIELLFKDLEFNNILNRVKKIFIFIFLRKSA